jgi:hypothetical protein
VVERARIVRPVRDNAAAPSYRRLARLTHPDTSALTSHGSRATDKRVLRPLTSRLAASPAN